MPGLDTSRIGIERQIKADRERTALINNLAERLGNAEILIHQLATTLVDVTKRLAEITEGSELIAVPEVLQKTEPVEDDSTSGEQSDSEEGNGSGESETDSSEQDKETGSGDPDPIPGEPEEGSEK